MVNIRVRVERAVVDRWLDDWRSHLGKQTPLMTSQVAEEVLQQVIENHPVDTGEAVQGWRDGAVRAGLNTGGGGTVVSGGERTELTITNDVYHVVYLEYGTRQMRPYAMVRKSLQEVGRQLSKYWELLFNS